MKRVWNKLFFADSPEKGAFFGIVLLILGTWLLGTVVVLCGGVASLLYTHDFVTGQLRPEGGRWLISSGALLLVFVLYFLFQQSRFWWNFRWNECDGSCKKWLGASLLLWLAALICGVYALFLVQKYGFSEIYSGFTCIKAPGAALLTFAALFLLLLLTSVLSTAKFFSAAGKFSYKEIFTLPVKILAAAVILAYAGMISASLIIQKKVCRGKAGS
jgi:hypothetical protein